MRGMRPVRPGQPHLLPPRVRRAVRERARTTAPLRPGPPHLPPTCAVRGRARTSCSSATRTHLLPPLLALPRLRPAHHQFLDESRGIVHFLWIQKGVHAGEMPAFSRFLDEAEESFDFPRIQKGVHDQSR